ncbi:MAG: DUF222 domain-containing protein, partial [Mycobacteriales bacterium]
MFDAPRPDSDLLALADQPLSGDLVTTLSGLDLDHASTGELAAVLTAWTRLGSWMTAEAIGLTARIETAASSGDFPCPAREEVAWALGIAPGTAEGRLEMARTLTDRMPATLAALRAGEISLGHVYALRRHLDQLTDTDCRRLEAELAKEFTGHTPGSLARVAARRVALLGPPA